MAQAAVVSVCRAAGSSHRVAVRTSSREGAYKEFYFLLQTWPAQLPPCVTPIRSARPILGACLLSLPSMGRPSAPLTATL